MFNLFEELFTPGRRHAEDERRRLEHTRVEEGSSDPGAGPIDLSSGHVLIRRPPGQRAAPPDGDAPDAGPRDGAASDGGTPDGSLPDGSVPDGSVPDGDAGDRGEATGRGRRAP